MDASIRRQFLAGSLRVPLPEIEPHDWLDMIGRMIEQKPLIGSFDGLKPLSAFLNGPRNNVDSRVTDLTRVTFPDGVDKKTRAMFVHAPLHVVKGDLEGKPDPGFVNRREIYLTQDAIWLGVDLRYKRQSARGRTGVDEVTNSVSIEILSEDDLLDLFRNAPHGLCSFSAIKDAIVRGAENTQARADALKRLADRNEERLDSINDSGIDWDEYLKGNIAGANRTTL